MWRTYSILTAALALLVNVGCTTSESSRFTLWYDSPANQFIEALVMGNGEMGATIYGGVKSEQISLNESTLWSGEPVDLDAAPQNAAKHLADIRKALEEEDYIKAEKLQRGLQGHFSQCYMPMAMLRIAFEGDSVASSYRRELNIANAVTNVDYTIGDTDYHRTYFVSNPDKVLVIELTAEGEGVIDGKVAIDSKLRIATKIVDGVLVAEGYAPYNIAGRERNILWDEGRGIHFGVLVKPVEVEGSVECHDGGVLLKGCRRVVLLVTSATSFNGYDKDPVKEGRDYMAIAKKELASAEQHSFEALKERHIADYTQYFNRVDIDLDGKDMSNIPTDERLKAYAGGADDRDLEALYLHFSRYLMISASRTECVPMNLQGVWNEALLPPWNGNYTTNINLQQNYWPAEVFNLSELHSPLLSFLSIVAKTGAKTARNYYGCEGWCACHNSDLWAMSNPVGDGRGRPRWANWNMGGAWLATHLWEHYRFTNDKEYLAEYAYPLLKGASQFVLDWVVEDQKSGYIITSPSTSPENDFKEPTQGRKVATSYGATADLAIIRELLSATWSAAEILGVDAAFKAEIHTVLEQLYPYHIGGRGDLQEWYHDFEAKDPHHRHISHLIGMYPGTHISVERTPELAKAVRRSLELRGDEAMGWTKAWRIGLFARLFDGEEAYSTYRSLLNYTRDLNLEVKAAGCVGGTYPNMLDAGPPFQIDANFGAPAGVAELLLQSQFGSIDLLPALPKSWSEGSFRGLRARGAFEVDLKWQSGAVKSGSILSIAGCECTLRSRTPLKIKGAKATTKKVGEWYLIKFATIVGGRYHIERS